MSVFDTVDIDHRLVMIVCSVVDQGSFSLGFFMRHMDGFNYGQPTKNIFYKIILQFNLYCFFTIIHNIYRVAAMLRISMSFNIYLTVVTERQSNSFFLKVGREAFNQFIPEIS